MSDEGPSAVQLLQSELGAVMAVGGDPQQVRNDRVRVDGRRMLLLLRQKAAVGVQEASTASGSEVMAALKSSRARRSAAVAAPTPAAAQCSAAARARASTRGEAWPAGAMIFLG